MIPNPAFLEMYEKSKWSTHKVAAAWAQNQPYETPGSHIRTDGQTVWSYNHPIAHTNQYGEKILAGCRYSRTTVRHTGALAPFANIRAITPCHPEIVIR